MRRIILVLVLTLFGCHAFAQTGWKLLRVDSPMDDNSGIILEAKAAGVRAGNAPSDSAGLAIQCTRKDGLEVVFRTGLLLLTSGNVNDADHKGSIGGLFSKHSGASLSIVRIRFDQQKPVKEEWVMGASPSNLFAQKPKRFVDALLKNQVQMALLEAQPYGENPVVFEFDVSNLAQYKATLHDACGY